MLMLLFVAVATDAATQQYLAMMVTVVAPIAMLLLWRRHGMDAGRLQQEVLRAGHSAAIAASLAAGERRRGPTVACHALLVTAHPDDECMFFVPLLENLRYMRGVQVHVLCLSTGDDDADGGGDDR